MLFAICSFFWLTEKTLRITKINKNELEVGIYSFPESKPIAQKS